MKTRGKLFLIGALILVCFLAVFIWGKVSVYSSTKLPKLDSEITEVRIVAVPREFSGNPWLDATPVQVCYGYKSEGVWHDIPSENYNLRHLGYLGDVSPLFNVRTCEHLVEIGPYVVMMLLDGTDYDVVVSDTCGTEVQMPLEEYRSDGAGSSLGSKVCIYADNSSPFLSAFSLRPSLTAQTSVPRFLIVPLAEIDSSYAITRSYYDKETGELCWSDTITGQELLTYLGH